MCHLGVCTGDVSFAIGVPYAKLGDLAGKLTTGHAVGHGQSP